MVSDCFSMWESANWTALGATMKLKTSLALKCLNKLSVSLGKCTILAKFWTYNLKNIKLTRESVHGTMEDLNHSNEARKSIKEIQSFNSDLELYSFNNMQNKSSKSRLCSSIKDVFYYFLESQVFIIQKMSFLIFEFLYPPI